jgi:hypothetical protein
MWAGALPRPLFLEDNADERRPVLKPVPEDKDHDQKAYCEAVATLRERQMQGKERMRQRLAALSFTEKIKILEKLRDLEKAVATAGLRRKPPTEGWPKQ